MEPISFFLGASISFLIGYLFGREVLVLVRLLESLREIKKTAISNFTPRKKVVILNSKDSYLPGPESEEEELL